MQRCPPCHARGVLALCVALALAACTGGADSPDAGAGKPDAGGTTVPDAGQQEPDAGDETPDAGDETPDAGDETPDAGDETPDAGDETPDAGDETPDAGDETPDAGDETPDGGSGETGVPAEELAEALYDAFCDYVGRCGLEGLQDADLCRAAAASGGLGDRSTFDAPEAIQASVLAGKIDYDPVKGAACVAALRELACNDRGVDGVGSIPGCSAALVGKVPADEPCIAEAACVAGHYCARERAADGGECEGRCRAFGAGACDRDAHCLDGQRCLWTGDTSACVTPGGDGAACQNDEACQPGFTCVSEEDGRSCRPLPGEGEPCGGRCAEGLACVDVEGGSECRLPPGEGESCFSSRGQCGEGLTCFDPTPPSTCRELPSTGPCENNQCASGSWCDFGVFPPECRPRAGLDETCDRDEVCEEGLLCVGFDAGEATCRPAPGSGAPCLAFRCAAGSYCDTTGEEAVCAPLPGAGEDCVNGQCNEGAWCDDGACVALPGDGEPCSPLNTCAPGAGCFNFEDGLRCQASAGLGEPCDGRSCVEGAWCLWTGGDRPVCQPAPGVGESCEMSGVCAVGASCYRPTPDPDEVVCQPLPGEGEPCTPRDNRCAVGLRCQFGGDTPTCRGPAQEGSACDLERNDCPRGTVCVAAPPDGSATCRPSKALGEDCTELLECGGLISLNVCDPATSKCVRRPGVGEPCALLGDPPDAGMGICDFFVAYCDVEQEPPTCVALKGLGEECRSDVECGVFSGRECDRDEDGTRRCAGETREICEP